MKRKTFLQTLSALTLLIATNPMKIFGKGKLPEKKETDDVEWFVYHKDNTVTMIFHKDTLPEMMKKCIDGYYFGAPKGYCWDWDDVSPLIKDGKLP